jgi:hypothetical protein
VGIPDDGSQFSIVRLVEEDRVWGALKKQRLGTAASPVSIGRVELDLATPCLVLGGRNGAGKSRMIRSLANHLHEGGILVDLHHLCEQALIVLRSRDDFEQMKEEFDVLGPDTERRDDIQRIIGREYDNVEWYALEVEPSDQAIAERFKWGGAESLLPYFEVEHRGLSYTSRDMGLGEFSVHFLFWILEQYREGESLTLLLDEPDAFLPPVGASALLSRLLKICLDRKWSLVMTSHASEIIRRAVEEEAFVLLRTDTDGEIVAIHSKDDPAAADSLLEEPPVRHVLFVEDESAWMLTRVLVEALDRRLARSVELVWGNGSGYMAELQEHFPSPPRPEIKFAYVFDGDKREEIGVSKKNRWPALFLPTDADPDELFRTARLDPAGLASRLNVPEGELALVLDGMEGRDAHDWVNGLGERYERSRVLRVLAELWVETNAADAEAFLEELNNAL